MIMCRMLRLFETCLLFSALASTASAFNIDIIGGVSSTIGQTSVNGGGTPSSHVHNVFPSEYPYAETTEITSGASRNTTDYDFSGGHFSLAFSHVRDTSASASAFSHGDILFTVDEDVHYTVSGSYSVTDSNPRTAVFGASLRESGVSGYVFSSSQSSESTLHPSFVIGGMEGDLSNFLTGEIMGTLLAGRTYLFEYAAQISSPQLTSTTNASADGFAQLELTAIPEPGSGLLVGMGLLLLSSRQRSRIGRLRTPR